MSDQQQPTGAVRSSDVDKYSFSSIPPIGLLAVARTAGEGAEKYGRFNYMRGFPVYVYLDHAEMHITRYKAGDRTEPHLEHAAWNLMSAIQSAVLDPELSAPHMLGPGATLTPEMLKHMEETDPVLKERRKTSKPEPWSTETLPEVVQILKQRAEAKAETVSVSDEKKPVAINELVRTNILDRHPFVKYVRWESGTGFGAFLQSGGVIFYCTNHPQECNEIRDEIRKLNSFMSQDRCNGLWDTRFIVTRDGVEFTP